MKEIAARDLRRDRAAQLRRHERPSGRRFQGVRARRTKRRELKRRPIDFKTYGIGAQILRELGVGKMQVLSNPRKLGSMSGYGLEVTGFIPMPGCPATSSADTADPLPCSSALGLTAPTTTLQH